jgi:hypothetical protein
MVTLYSGQTHCLTEQEATVTPAQEVTLLMPSSFHSLQGTQGAVTLGRPHPASHDQPSLARVHLCPG